MSPTLRSAFLFVALLGGALAPFAGSPYASSRATIDVDALAADVVHENDHVTALELAQWIRDRKPGLRVIDVRGEASAERSLIPGTENIPLQSLSKASFREGDTIVLYSDGGAHAAQGWVFMRALGHQHVYFLRGGLSEWISEVLNPTRSATASASEIAAFQKVAELSRYFGGVPRVADSVDVPARPSSPPTSEAAAAEIRRRGC